MIITMRHALAPTLIQKAWTDAPCRIFAALLCLCLVMCATAPAFGAEEAAAPSAATAQETAKQPDAATGTAKNIKMNFRDVPLETVLEQLSDMSGLVIIKDVQVDGRISIISKQDMNVDEAIGLLNTVLKEKGYVGVRTGRILKVVKLEDAKKQNLPVRTGNDPAKVEANDEVFTQVIPIKFIDAVQLKKDFSALLPTYADLTANSSSNSLVMTDTGANIKRLMEIIHALDTQSTSVAQVKVFQLSYANATSVAKLITDTFNTTDTKSSSTTGNRGLATFMSGMRSMGGGAMGGGGPGAMGGGPGGAPEATASSSQESGQRITKVTASGDERTNAVVVSANPDTMTLIADMVKALDSNPAEEQSTFIYRCKNSDASNLASVINSLFGTTTSGTSSSKTSSSTKSSSSSSSSRSSSSSGISSSSGSSSSNTGVMGGGQFSLGGSSATGNTSGSSSTMPSSMQSGTLAGQVYVVADTDSNSLLVLTASKNFDRVKGIIAQLDKPVPQVLIKVLVAEVTHEKEDDIGVDMSILTDKTLDSLSTSFGVSSQTDGLITKVSSGDLTAILRALQTVGKMDILSRPYIMASDNQESSITVGQEVPFIVSSRTSDTGSTVNTIEYEDIGIILTVTAHINEDGLVIMDVEPEVSSLTGTSVTISETVSAPVFAKRSAYTRVGVKDGQTAVIGGLMEDKNTETTTSVPGLGKIPGMGWLFKRKIVDKSKTELLIFLTPHVAQDPAELKRMAEQEEKSLKLVRTAVDPGAFDNHLAGLKIGEAEPGDNGSTLKPPAATEIPAGSSGTTGSTPKHKSAIKPVK